MHIQKVYRGRTTAPMAGLLLLLLSLGCQKQGAKTAEDNPDEALRQTVVPVKIAAVRRSRYEQYGEFLGAVQAIQEVNLIAYAGGRVNKVLAVPGQVVKKNQKLCDIEGQKAHVIAESAVLQENIAKSKYDRLVLHYKNGSSSKLQVDQARLDSLQAQKSRIEAQKNRAGAFCITPISGIVTARRIEPYQDVLPGQLTLTVADLSQVKVVLGIPATEIDGYEVGGSGEVFDPDQPSRRWPVQLVSIEQKVDDRERTFRVEARVQGEQHEFKPGMTVRVRLLRYSWTEKLVIPRNAIINYAKRKVVMIAEGNRALMRDVVIRTYNGSDAVIESGIEEGDALIVSGQALVTEGTPIKIIENQAGIQ